MCITLLMMMSAGPQNVLSVSGPKMAQATDAATILYHIIDEEPLVNPRLEGTPIDENKFKGNIEFTDVCFNYPTRPDLKVLTGFNVNIESGKSTALVGPSGSGKSTVIQLIERFYNPESGSITVDGVPIQDLNLREFRR